MNLGELLPQSGWLIRLCKNTNLPLPLNYQSGIFPRKIESMFLLFCFVFKDNTNSWMWLHTLGISAFWEVDAGELEIQGHAQLYMKSKASLGCIIHTTLSHTHTQTHISHTHAHIHISHTQRHTHTHIYTRIM